MKKITLIVTMMFATSLAFAQVSNKNASYEVSSKTLTFTGGKYNGRFVLPVNGNLNAYKTLVVETTNPIGYRITITYNDGAEKKKKDFYQSAKTGKSIKRIDLSNPEHITSLKEVESVVIQSAEGNGSMLINSVYLIERKKNKRKEIELK